MGTVLTGTGRVSKEVWGTLDAVVAADNQGRPSPWDSKQFLPFHPYIQDYLESHDTVTEGE